MKRGDYIRVDATGQTGVVVDRTWDAFRGIPAGMVLVYFGEDSYRSTMIDTKLLAWHYDSEVHSLEKEGQCA